MSAAEDRVVLGPHGGGFATGSMTWASLREKNDDDRTEQTDFVITRSRGPVG
jgi:hypothetical protein